MMPSHFFAGRIPWRFNTGVRPSHKYPMTLTGFTTWLTQPWNTRRLQAATLTIFSMACILYVIARGNDDTLNQDVIYYGFLTLWVANGVYHLGKAFDPRARKPSLSVGDHSVGVVSDTTTTAPATTPPAP